MKARLRGLRRASALLLPALLLAGLYLWSCLRPRPAASEEGGGPVEIIRVGHIFLDQQAAFQAMASAYEEICRRRGEAVRIVQVAVPQGVYAGWFTTQLAGGTLPDLVAINVGGSTERLARYFEPLGAEMAVPNPYNAGTDLADVRWRDTFPDGLPTSYNATLLDYYTVPMTNTTTRLVINRALYREICGEAPLPATYDELIALCRRTEAFAARTGRRVAPIAGSLYHAPVLFRFLTRTQTRELAEQLNFTRSLRFSDAEERLGYLNGTWSLGTPAIQDLLAMTGEVAAFMTPGFSQLRREDAVFYFAQGQALMIISFSNEAKTIPDLVDFPVDAFRVPMPDPATPRYGRHVASPVEDRSFTSNFSLALSRGSAHQARAIDFLRFAGSRRGNQIFCDRSGWIPSVAGVATAPDLAAYQPDPRGGYLQGFDLCCYDITQAGEANRVFTTHVHLLDDAEAGPARFRRQAAGEYDAAIRRDAARELADTWSTLQRDDVKLAMLDRLAPPGSAADAVRRDRVWEASLEQEATARMLRGALARRTDPFP